MAEFFTAGLHNDASWMSVVHSATAFLGTVLERRIARNELRRKFQESERLIADLKSTQTQLVHAEKMASVGVMAAGVAHELNTPVAYVMSNLRTFYGTFKAFIVLMIG